MPNPERINDMEIKIHYPVLIFDDVFCTTACGLNWYRPDKKIKAKDVNCGSCKRTKMFRKFALKG